MPPRTTIVVGAGASVPYGLPTAIDISKSAKSIAAGDEIFRLLAAALDDAALLTTTLDDIKRHPAESIDQYLEHRHHRDRTAFTAKALIAAVLGREMLAARRREPRPGEDWIRHVVSWLGHGARRPDEFAKRAAAVTFITFNFDSILEEQIGHLIRHMYADEEASLLSEALRAVKIIHVHGRLPTLPASDSLLDSTRVQIHVQGSHYPPRTEWVDWVRAAAQAIRVIQDDIDDETLTVVREHIAEARILCFLGFSFETSNLGKLGIPGRLVIDTYRLFFGCAYRMPQSDRERIATLFANTIRLGSDTQDCLAFLRGAYVLRD